GLHIFEDAFIIQVVDFETGEVLPPGHRGNIVVTELYKTGTQQLRYNMQDVSGLMTIEQCDCGSWHQRMESFQGRSDTMVKLRGVNVWPETCGAVIQGNVGVAGEYFAYVERVTRRDKPARDEMTLMVEAADGAGDHNRLRVDLEQLLKRKIGVQITVAIVDRDSLRHLTGHGHRAKLKRFE